jgi:hypothetical protein
MLIFQNSEKDIRKKGVSRWKNRLRSLFDPVRLGHVKIAITSSKIQNTGPPPIH